MIGLTLTIGQNSAETARRIGTALGAITGALGVFFFGWWFLIHRSGE